MTKVSTWIGVVVLSACLNAAHASEVWSTSTKIRSIYPTQTSLFFLTEYSSSLGTCDAGGRFEIRNTDPNYEILSSALMAAFFGDYSIRVNNEDTGPRCALRVNRFFVDR